MSHSFNLVDKPFIPCVFPDGTTDELGLRETLVRSHEIGEIRDSSPLVTVSLYRLLLAILHRNFGPKNLNAWERLWNAGRWDEFTLDRYFERWRHRFDLCDAKYPFYQTPGIRAVEHPVCRLILVQANKPTLFDHRSDRRAEPVPPAQAARWLVAFQNFAVALGVSKPFSFRDAPLTRGLVVLAGGNSLFENLICNLVLYNKESPMPSSPEDVPTWERDAAHDPAEEGNAVSGYVDYLTWQSRRIQLIPRLNRESLHFTQCRILQNLVLPKPKPIDPAKCYRRDKTHGLVEIPLSARRAVWRDSHALFRLRGEEFRRPEVLNLLARACRAGVVPKERRYALSVFGLATEPGKAANIEIWRHEVMPLSLQYLDDQALVDHLVESLGFVRRRAKPAQRRFGGAEGAAAILQEACRTIAKLAAGEDQNTRDSLTFQAARVYWSQLEGPFRELLVSLPGDPEHRLQQLRAWARLLCRTAHEAFRQVTGGLGSTAHMLRAIVAAEARLREQLASIKRPYEENHDDEYNSGAA